MGWFKDLFFGKPQNGVGGERTHVTKADTITELYEHLVEWFNEYPSLIGVLTVEHTNPWTHALHTKKLYLKKIDSALYAFDLKLGSPVYWTIPELTRNMLSTMVDDYDRHGLKVKLNISWHLDWITPSSIPKVTEGFVTNALASAIPFTARQVFEGSYVESKSADDLGARYRPAYLDVADQLTLSGIIPYWYTDLAFSVGALKPPADPNKYIIVEPCQVDRKILPVTHWRRWTEVSIAKDSSKAAVKYVPCDIGYGYVQYFDIVFNFDDPSTAGMAFSATQMLEAAVTRLQHDCDKNIGEKAPHNYGYGEYHTPPKSNVYINTDALKVIWHGEVLALQDYLDIQRESSTNLERPYFAPNQSVVKIDGNKFSIDSDYYINYTPRESKK